MDSHTDSLRRVQRLDVVENGRRRRWSVDEKLRIVPESLPGPRLVSATARRHRISRLLLLEGRMTPIKLKPCSDRPTSCRKA